MTVHTHEVSRGAHSMELALKILECCSEAKAKDLALLDVSSVFDLASYFVIVSGRSDRQVQGISNRVLATLDAMGIEPISRDGYDEGHWVLMDYGDVIVHIFYEPVREHYDLERLWKNSLKVNLPETLDQRPEAA
jgi:ribosome-associated protein